MELDRLLLMLATAGIWMLVLGSNFGTDSNSQILAPDVVAEGVKSALNDCAVQTNGKFLCR